MPPIDPEKEQPGRTTSLDSLAVLYPLAMIALAASGIWFVVARKWHRLPPVSGADLVTTGIQRSVQHRPLLFVVPFVLFTAMLMLELIGVQVVAAARDVDLRSIDDLPPRESIEAMTILKSAEYCFALPALCAAFWWQGRLRARELRKPVGLFRGMSLGAGALLLAWPVVASVGFIAALFEQIVTGEPPREIAHSTLEDLIAPEAGGSTWPLIGLVVFGAAIFEEVLYRGLLQESIKHFAQSRWVAIAGTSVIFTLMHGGAVPLTALPALFALSLALGWAYEKSNSLLPPILAHMGFNALNIALAMGAAP